MQLCEWHTYTGPVVLPSDVNDGPSQSSVPAALYLPRARRPTRGGTQPLLGSRDSGNTKCDVLQRKEPGLLT